MLTNPALYRRHDVIAPAATVEDAEMTNAFLQKVEPLILRQGRANLVRRDRLAGSGDVVQLTLDREQGGIGNRPRFHWNIVDP